MTTMHVTDDVLSALAKEIPHVSSRTLRTLAALDDEKINMDLIEELLQSIVDTSDSGAILVFLPGLMEITTLYERLMGDTKVFGNPEVCVVYPLHSTLSTAEQKAVFNRPPEGVRKIVISTNVRGLAESLAMFQSSAVMLRGDLIPGVQNCVPCTCVDVVTIPCGCGTRRADRRDVHHHRRCRVRR